MRVRVAQAGITAAAGTACVLNELGVLRSATGSLWRGLYSGAPVMHTQPAHSEAHSSQTAASSKADTARLTDLRHPASWYPGARALSRTIICHLGPTNSGKTHAALQALKDAETGVYCGPLRLLACEVSDRLNAAGVPCSLLTGQEVRQVEGARHTSCTVEMAAVGSEASGHVTEVAVLDEIQMIGDSCRGWAWTRAMLGLRARQVHLCGDPGALPLIQQLARDCGDTLQVHHYTRLSSLVVSGQALGSLSNVKPGDALVAFSRRAVHGLQREVAKLAPWANTSLVYGALPPDARRHQAAVFNQGSSGFDVLLSSDAIGMGLNLAVQRVVFTSMSKYDGTQVRPLMPSEVRQIAGRAGRYGVKQQQHQGGTGGQQQQQQQQQGATGGQQQQQQGATGGQQQQRQQREARYTAHTPHNQSHAASSTQSSSTGLQGNRGDALRDQPGHRTAGRVQSLAGHNQQVRAEDDDEEAVQELSDVDMNRTSSSSDQYDDDTITLQDLILGHYSRAHTAGGGYVTCLFESDLPLLHAAMQTAPTPIPTACLLPRSSDLALYCDLQRGQHGDETDEADVLPLDQLIRKYMAEAQLSPHYQLSDMSGMLSIASLLSGTLCHELSVSDYMVFCMAPADVSITPVAAALLRFVALFVEDGVVPLSTARLNININRVPTSEVELRHLEEAHAVLDLYVWLAYRLPLAFRDLSSAQAERASLAALITQGLSQLAVYHHRRTRASHTTSTRGHSGHHHHHHHHADHSRAQPQHVHDDPGNRAHRGSSSSRTRYGQGGRQRQYDQHHDQHRDQHYDWPGSSGRDGGRHHKAARPRSSSWDDDDGGDDEGVGAGARYGQPPSGHRKHRAFRSRRA